MGQYRTESSGAQWNAEGAHPPVSWVMVGHDAKAIFQSMGNDVVAEVSIRLGVSTRAMPGQKLCKDITLEHVYAHAGLKGVL